MTPPGLERSTSWTHRTRGARRPETRSVPRRFRDDTAK